MFEVIVMKRDGTCDTWDCLSNIQAEYVFFLARMISTTETVEINEFVD